MLFMLIYKDKNDTAIHVNQCMKCSVRIYGKAGNALFSFRK